MTLFNDTMPVVRQLDRIIKETTRVEELDNYIAILDNLYESINDMTDEKNFSLLLRRITTIKKSANLQREQIIKEKEEEETAMWLQKQQYETRCLHIAAHIAFFYVSVLAVAAYINCTV
jgi:predicted CopG family antitoxin